MASTGAQERLSFQRQPARAVLVDFHPPMDSGTCLHVQEALSSSLSLLHHLSGPTRLPFLCIIALGSYPECIFPFQPVRGNFSRLQGSLTELQSLARGTFLNRRSNGCLLEGLQEALSQFHRMAQNFRQSVTTPSFPSQVEVTLITALSPHLVRSRVEQIADRLDLEHLRKISAACVSNPERMVQWAGNEGEGEGGGMEVEEEGGLSPSFSQMPSELGMSILDLTVVDNDIHSLQNIFKSWLHDCGTDSEYLHLSLPSPVPGGHQLSLKCDLQERMLDPASLVTLGYHFYLHSVPPPHVPTSHTTGNASTTSQSLPVYKLRSVGLVAADGVCESVLYGKPLVVRPTTCWKLDWEELENNQQHFHALCSALRERNQMLLACADTLTSTSTSSHDTLPTLHPHFLLLPSHTLTLLIKPILVNELLLPIDLPFTEDKPSQQIQQSLRNSLEQLEEHQSYNPLMVDSGLHNAIAALSVKKTQLSRAGRGGSRGGRGRGRGGRGGGGGGGGRGGRGGGGRGERRDQVGSFQSSVQREPSGQTGSSYSGRRNSRSLGPKRSYSKGTLRIHES